MLFKRTGLAQFLCDFYVTFPKKYQFSVSFFFMQYVLSSSFPSFSRPTPLHGLFCYHFSIKKQKGFVAGKHIYALVSYYLERPFIELFIAYLFEQKYGSKNRNILALSWRDRIVCHGYEKTIIEMQGAINNSSVKTKIITKLGSLNFNISNF